MKQKDKIVSNPVSGVSEETAQGIGAVEAFLAVVGDLYKIVSSVVTANLPGLLGMPKPAQVTHYLSLPPSSGVVKSGGESEPVLCEAFLPTTDRKRFHARPIGDGYVSLISPLIKDWHSVVKALYYNVARFAVPGDMTNAGADWKSGGDAWTEIKTNLGLTGNQRNLKATVTCADSITRLLSDYVATVGPLPIIPTIEAWRDKADEKAETKMHLLVGSDTALASLPGIGKMRANSAIKPYLSPDRPDGFLAFVRRDTQSGLIVVLATFSVKEPQVKAEQKVEAAA